VVFLYLLQINQMKKIYLPLLLLFFSFCSAQNQTVFKDPGYQSPKLTYTNYELANGGGASAILIKSVKRQTDGKLLIGGVFTNYDGNPVSGLVRLNEDGSIDTTFYFINQNLEVASIENILIQTDGKILILVTYSGIQKKLIRLLPNGDRDTTYTEAAFGENGGQISCEIQTDNKVVLAVSGASQINGVSNNGLIRLNTNGTVDAGFNSPFEYCQGWVNATFMDLKIDSNGKIIVIGDELYFPNCIKKTIACLNANGTEDTTFVPSAEVAVSTNYLTKISLLSDNKIMIIGTLPGLTGQNGGMCIVKLNLNGTIDANFNYHVVQSQDYVYGMAVQPDDKLIVSVKSNSLYNGSSVKEVFRINTTDGSIDAAFDLGPAFVETLGHTVSGTLYVKPNGNILASGDFTVSGNQSSGLIEVNPSGTLNANFNIGTGFKGNGYVNKIQEVGSGKILIAGAFDTVDGIVKRGIARLNADGTLDATFNSGGEGFGLNSIIRTYAIQADGKIIVGGKFNSYNGLPNINLIRLNADGSIDTSFAPVTEFYSSYIQGFVNPMVNSIAIQNDNKIVIAGAFVIFNGVSKKNILRLNADGTLDTTFNTGVGFNTEVVYMQLQSDQKIVVAGTFTSYNNVAVASKFIRLNTNGTKDNSFNPVGYTYSPKKFQVLSNGKILAVRLQFTQGGRVEVLEKLNPDGSVAPGFAFNMEYSNVLDFCVQPDDKILVASSSYYNVLKKISRFNDDGTVDTGFDVGLGVSKNNAVDFAYGYLSYAASMYEIDGEGNAKSLFLQNDGKILVGGYFTHFNNETAVGTTRLLNVVSYNVKGQNKLDQNINGCDSADLPFANLKFNVLGAGTTFNYIGNQAGNYNIGTIAGSYSITPVFENPTYFTASPSSVTVNFPTQTSPQLQNFCITPNSVHADLEVTLLPLTVARPGFDAMYKMVYKNKGNQLESGTINLVFNDAVLDLVSATPTTSSQSLNNLNWSFSNLNPFETREILFTLNLNTPTETPSVNSGFVLNYTASVSSAFTDDLPADNTITLSQIVLNSLDPNDKKCLEGTNIALSKVGDYVHYMIRFENSGNFAAQNVSVRDVIDSAKYDINTLVPISGSHSFITKITEGAKVEFYFENINLPYLDATNDGYVAFKIKTKATLIAGDSFSNTAAIYFDYNEAIITNTATTVVQPNLGTVDVIAQSSFVLFPNPVNGILNISKKQEIEISSISIYNTLGQVILIIPNAQNTESIDVNALKTGNYFVKVNSDKGTIVSKFIKI
jgi:uncharacterized delta-60 repeat protein/uncharacterized repeat protein (TIGR01451 family)